MSYVCTNTKTENDRTSAITPDKAFQRTAKSFAFVVR